MCDSPKALCNGPELIKMQGNIPAPWAAIAPPRGVCGYGAVLLVILEGFLRDASMPIPTPSIVLPSTRVSVESGKAMPMPGTMNIREPYRLTRECLPALATLSDWPA